MKHALIGAVPLLLVSSTYAEAMSRHELHALCKAPSASQRYAIGLRYTLGEISTADASGRSGRLYCRAYGMKVEQAHRVVCQWLKLNPQHRHEEAGPLLRVALGEIWPCTR
ncbi:Rap1a/Tai family immunity protein [Methylobacterium nigriterrae]|uniref:Rap1a/Tai family immunity protein n=1 Tax=Methylobacterium nigriterrae TaxID=3127512 RepID=UPI003D66F90E